MWCASRGVDDGFVRNNAPGNSRSVFHSFDITPLPLSYPRVDRCPPPNHTTSPRSADRRYYSAQLFRSKYTLKLCSVALTTTTTTTTRTSHDGIIVGRPGRHKIRQRLTNHLSLNLWYKNVPFSAKMRSFFCYRTLRSHDRSCIGPRFSTGDNTSGKASLFFTKCTAVLEQMSRCARVRRVVLVEA